VIEEPRGVTGNGRYEEPYGDPGVRRSILVWLVFAIPFVVLSKLSWLESIVWWLVLGFISLLIAGVTVGIVQAVSKFDEPDPTLSPSRDAQGRRESLKHDRGAGMALVASMATWAIAWLLILSTLIPEQTIRRSGLDTAWSIAGVGMLAAAVLVMCGAIAVAFRSGEHMVSGALWLCTQLAGLSLAEKLGGPAGLVVALILSVAAITGWLWLLMQAMRFAALYAGWSR
jgi:hypothetical protein